MSQTQAAPIPLAFHTHTCQDPDCATVLGLTHHENPDTPGLHTHRCSVCRASMTESPLDWDAPGEHSHRCLSCGNLYEAGHDDHGGVLDALLYVIDADYWRDRDYPMPSRVRVTNEVYRGILAALPAAEPQPGMLGGVIGDPVGVPLVVDDDCPEPGWRLEWDRDPMRKGIAPYTPLGGQDVHIGRSWSGTDLEDDCPCPKQPCGLVAWMEVVGHCPEHALWAMKTIRQTHYEQDCPGRQ